MDTISLKGNGGEREAVMRPDSRSVKLPKEIEEGRRASTEAKGINDEQCAIEDVCCSRK